MQGVLRVPSSAPTPGCSSTVALATPPAAAGHTGQAQSWPSFALALRPEHSTPDGHTCCPLVPQTSFLQTAYPPVPLERPRSCLSAGLPLALPRGFRPF